jgi:glycosyltransferase involved in cell wall biosynthesis
MQSFMLPKIGIASTDWSRTLVDKTGHPEPGGSGWVRLQQLRPHWRFPSVTGTLMYHDKFGYGIADFYGKVHFDCAVIILQRMMFKDMIRTMNLVKNRPVRPYIINDLDDWYWGLDKANAAYEITRPEKNPEENIDHYAEILKLSDAVIVSTPFLKDKMENWLGHKNVKMVSNHVTVRDFNVRRYTNKRPVVGWVGSTAHRSNDLEELRGLFDLVPNRVHHSGHLDTHPTFHKAIGVNPGRVTLSPMEPPRRYARQSFCFDIGLAPLRDIPFNHAKSWIKMIEYAAAGIPMIASPAPEYLRLHQEYGIGRIAKSIDEWAEHIKELGDPRVRQAEAKRNRDLVKDLDVPKMADQWAEVFESLL